MAAPPHADGGRRAQLVGAVVGILGFFVAYGYLQEKIMSTPYGESATRFTDSGTQVTRRADQRRCGLERGGGLERG